MCIFFWCFFFSFIFIFVCPSFILPRFSSTIRQVCDLFTSWGSLWCHFFACVNFINADATLATQNWRQFFVLCTSVRRTTSQNVTGHWQNKMMWICFFFGRRFLCVKRQRLRATFYEFRMQQFDFGRFSYSLGLVFLTDNIANQLICTREQKKKSRE